MSDLVAARGQIGERRGTFEQLFHQFGAALKGQPLEESTAIKTERTEVMEVEKEAPAAVAETGDPSKYVRVPIDRLDGLVRLVGELFVSRSIFERHLASYVKEVDELGLSLERLKRLTSQLETEHAIFSPGVVSAVNYSTDKPEFDALEFDRYSKLHLLSRDLAETADDVASVGGQLRGRVAQPAAAGCATSSTSHVRRDASQRGVKGKSSVKVWKPVEIEQRAKMFPRSGIEAIARGVRQVGRGAAHLFRRQRHGAVLDVAANYFARGVKEKRVPEISRYGLVSLAKFAGDGGGDGAGERM